MRSEPLEYRTNASTRVRKRLQWVLARPRCLPGESRGPPGESGRRGLVQVKGAGSGPPRHITGIARRHSCRRGSVSAQRGGTRHALDSSIGSRRRVCDVGERARRGGSRRRAFDIGERRGRALSGKRRSGCDLRRVLLRGWLVLHPRPDRVSPARRRVPGGRHEL